MKVFSSFMIVGALCLVASLIYDLTKLTSGHITSLYVIVGCFLGIFDLYDKLIEKFGYGLTTPIISFGSSLTKSAYTGLKEEGIIGLFDFMFKSTSSGISAAIIFSFLISLIFKPKS